MTQEAKWNSKYIEVMESSVFFEVKEGPFVEHEVDGYWRRRGALIDDWRQGYGD